ncbi:MAG: EAL domain-containing protein [Colwellia sp.]|nr:EAL domain-containing protein [Colwellia sp.]
MQSNKLFTSSLAAAVNVKKTILVVDDNPTNLQLVFNVLSEHNYKVRLANNGSMAITSIKSNPPDLVLLDICMPGMDGYSVCETLKNDTETCNIPIIFLSAIEDSINVIKGFSVGGIDFITKPFKTEILLARINTHLTVSDLQNELREANNDLESRVALRTRQLSKTNTTLINEIEKRVEIEGKLRDSETFHRLTLENLGETIVITTDKEGKFSYISQNIEEILGYTPTEVNKLGEIHNFIHIDNETANSDFNNINVYAKDGSACTFNVSIKESDRVGSTKIYTLQDVTKRKIVEEERAESAIRLKHALNVSNEGIWDWNIISDKIFYNDTFFTMLGYSITNLPVKNNSWFCLLHPDDSNKCQQLINDCIADVTDSFKIECRLKRKEDGYLWIMAKGKIVERNDFNKPIRLVGTHTDIKEVKDSEARLKHQASYDSLTQLPNRQLFTDLLKKSIENAKRKKYENAILFIDLDRFKTVNDSLGHSAGDDLLIDVSKRLSGILRGTDTVSRLGGDEFTILLEDVGSTHKAADVSNRVIEALKPPFNLLGRQVVISPSIGIAIYPDHGDTPEVLLKNADTAMYSSKDRGGSCFEFFSGKMNTAANMRLELEADLRDGINKNEIIQYYQPQVDIDTGEISGFESLARWQRGGKLIPPNQFIPIAEETGLIVPMGEIILAGSLRDAKKWMQYNPFIRTVSVNISAVQLRQKNILDVIDSIIERCNFPVENLELELTETVAMEDAGSAFQLMKAIKDRGISLALDDFGTGYSSLSYLTRFPIDTLKIDMSFVNSMDKSAENKNIVKSIIDLSHNLKFRVVAEGVETRAQMLSLKEMGCDTIQGYYYSKPIDCQSVSDLLKKT